MLIFIIIYVSYQHVVMDSKKKLHFIMHQILTEIPKELLLDQEFK